MPKKYLISYCSLCQREFLTPKLGGRKETRYCPFCGDDVEVLNVRTISLEQTLHHARAWTKEEDETLIYGRRKNTPYKVIAETLGTHRTPKACRERMVLLKRRGVTL